MIVLIIHYFFCLIVNSFSIHAGAAPKAWADVPIIPFSALNAAIKEYEDDEETEDNGGDGELIWMIADLITVFLK